MSALIDETVELLPSTQSTKARVKVAPMRTGKLDSHAALDFTIPVRPFIKKYSKELSGAKKFVLLVARLTGGDVAKTVSLDDVVKQWNKMKARGLLGMKFNHFYPAAAKDKDWVATGKSGLYHLRPSWKEILK
jgi:hypothetical protein